MEALILAGLELITTAVNMIKDAKQASAEKSAEIAARFTSARAVLSGAYDEAHAGLAALAEAAKGSGS